MEFLRYAQFLPAEYRREPMVEPRSTWWSWRGRRVHVARANATGARVRVLAVHGAGGHAGLMWPFAALAVQAGVDAMAIDMPLYGDTAEPDPRSVRYTDWVDLLCEFVCAETESDPRPLIVFGASMGGMLAYEVAARTGCVAHVVATCLLDPADSAARRAAVRWSPTGGVAPAVMRAVRPLAGGLRVPIRWLVDMENMSLNRELSRMCSSDPKGGGVRVPLGFLADFLDFPHTRPETFTTAPVTLVLPAADRWTPPELSMRFLERVAAPIHLTLLEGCGHFPIEDPGLGQLKATLTDVLAETAGALE
ncbi:alpha/beta hydrolase [Nocardia sp. NPDC059180]|uniref:alpha/beta hydrolase n=1 Tax=Nocardia sp. NPDC059180 TaxID=3346761 RepID=UPI00369D5EC7